MPGRHVTDRQKRLFMTLKKTHTIDVAAAKAGFSRATGYRLAEDPSLLSGKAAPRGRRRPDPLADIFETEVVPILENSPGNYRHVIHSLKRKPMALLNLVYRDALFPRDAYRRCFEAALERLTEREACRLAVTLLALAHEENCEAELAAEIDRVLDKGRLPAPNAEARFAPDPGKMPRIDVARPYLAGYDPC